MCQLHCWPWSYVQLQLTQIARSHSHSHSHSQHQMHSKFPRLAACTEEQFLRAYILTQQQLWSVAHSGTEHPPHQQPACNKPNCNTSGDAQAHEQHTGLGFATDSSDSLLIATTNDTGTTATAQHTTPPKCASYSRVLVPFVNLFTRASQRASVCATHALHCIALH
jgi:hypothetical protein